ncbi:MAG: AAA family ATPase [Planctomycetes bacterium]|nr:AAA family ATPase [Planctomycetota bacterium]
MITSFRIRGFRGFDDFELSELRQINLLVGENNGGKTSILEAIHLLQSQGSPSAIRAAMYRRGEVYREGNEGERPRPHLDVCHLFHGHQIAGGAEFRLDSSGKLRDRTLEVSVLEPSDYENKDVYQIDLPPSLEGSNILFFGGSPEPVTAVLVLTSKDGLSVEQLDRFERSNTGEDPLPVFFVTTETQSAEFLARHWEGVALTEEEDLLIKALQVLEPRVERIALLGDRPFFRSSKSGVIVRLKGERTPVPLGSMGDGMWRMLTLVLATIRSQNGILLVDEIDTGLHHTTMSDMWRLVISTAQRLNVQVFATTHSLDCVNSLANVIAEEETPAETVTIQRVEKERSKAVAYSENEVVVAANRGTEMR